MKIGFALWLVIFVVMLIVAAAGGGRSRHKWPKGF